METKHNHRLKGLSLAEVHASRKRYGTNVLTQQQKKGFFAQYLASFGDPIIKILLLALGVNIIFLFRDANWYETAGIAIAVLLATLVSTISEYGSESAFEKLQEEASEINCRVNRDGILSLLPITELVVGDVVLLQAGERIPADGHMLDGEIFVDQSALNGESKEVRKYPGTKPADLAALASHTVLLRGSVVCDGEGIMEVNAVGDETFYGKMASELQAETIESPLKEQLRKLAGTISKIGYTAAIVVAVANLFNHFILDSGFDKAIIMQKLTTPSYIAEILIATITLSITVVVMAVPEGLPMMITVVLSANMKKMLKDHVLVRKLVGIETAGSMNILFTDKTGTLTQGKLSVTAFACGNGKVYEATKQLPQTLDGLFPALLTGCLYNTDSQIIETDQYHEIIGGNATDRALLNFALPYMNEVRSVSLKNHIPFHSKNKMSISQIVSHGQTLYLVKGAPEYILPHVKTYLDELGNPRPFHDGNLKQTMNTLGKQAIRMLAVAQSDHEIQPGLPLKPLTLIGLFCIRDDIRPEAPVAISDIISAGIQPVMITGDNPETAVAIATEAGLITGPDDSGRILTSSQLAQMGDQEVRRQLPHLRVVARALPNDKSRLVRIAQEMGLVAGMTGDGVNDAPALKKADVGFGMGAGTEVAKEASDIVILDNNISSIANAILYGRTIFKSIRKFIIFQLTINFCAVALSAICPLIGVDAPLTVVQMLWVNIIMDTLAGLAFSGEAPLKEYMKEPPKKRGDEIINRYMYNQILFTGSYTTLLCIAFLKLPFFQTHFGYNNGTDYFMTAFFVLFIFASVFNSLNARTYRLNLLAHLWRNKMFIVIMILVSLIQLVFVYFGNSLFRTTGISPLHLQMLIIAAASVIPADLLRKQGLRLFGRTGHI